MDSKERYLRLLEAIKNAAKTSGRSAEEITLVAVTKTLPWEECAWLYHLGHRHFGENRLVAALDKKASAPPDCRWHLIGTLQSNKVKKAIGQFTLIHSVDSLHLAEKISTLSLEIGIKTQILLQANTSGEPSKHGLTPDEWKRCYETIVQLEGISLQGLMTMAPATKDEKLIRSCFARLRNLREELKAVSPSHIPMQQLSMGMSNDFPFAIAEGATIVRIGTALLH